MLQHISHVQLWVRDQEEALDFYINKIGLELRSDVQPPGMNGFRFISAGPPLQPQVQFFFVHPGPPVIDGEPLERLLELIAQGAMPATYFEVEDCQATYDELAARGVEFQEEPAQRPWGIDAGFRDPSGNNFRIVQSMPIDFSISA
jgi:catechol 2,3-dioxygenase-like lactoylglutathione lyase family enzyme